MARDMARDCERERDRREASFWREVALAIDLMANPQPLIAPAENARELEGPSAERRPQERAAMKLPGKRSNVLRFRKRLRSAMLDVPEKKGGAAKKGESESGK
jgi:hypothetical protein